MSLSWNRKDLEKYLRDWIQHSRESIEAEQQQVISPDSEFFVPYTITQVEAINHVYVICKRFELENHAKYLAIHLFDRYVQRWFWELVTAGSRSDDTAKSISVKQMREKMSSQAKLVMAVCVQIASKVDMANTGLGISQIQDLLQSIDPKRPYSKNTIYTCEMRILRTLDFRIPYCLPIDAIELFLIYVELADHRQLRDTCYHLLDMAYLRHGEIYEQLYLMTNGEKYDKSAKKCRRFIGIEIDSAFLAAAIIVCSNFFFMLKKSMVDCLVVKLARLIDTNPMNVNVMANIVFTMALDEEDFKDAQDSVGEDVGST